MDVARFLELVSSSVSTSPLLDSELADGGRSVVQAQGFVLNVSDLAEPVASLSISFTATLTERGSTFENMSDICLQSTQWNFKKGITGVIKYVGLLGVESATCAVDQVIEGPFPAVIMLWQKIKADQRIDAIVSSSYVISGERKFYTRFIVNTEPFATSAFARGFMADHIKLR